jgi:small subunit ribosomal protein S16
LIIFNELNAYRSARDSKPLEVVGTYNPLPQKPTNLSEEEAKVAKAFKEISIDRSRVKYWLGVGAQPTESVWRLLSLVRDIFITLNEWMVRKTRRRV